MCFVSNGWWGCHCAHSFSVPSLSFPLTAVRVPVLSWLWSTPPRTGKRSQTLPWSPERPCAQLSARCGEAVLPDGDRSLPFCFACSKKQKSLNKPRGWWLNRREDGSARNPAGPCLEDLGSCAAIFAPAPSANMAWSEIQAIYQARGLKPLRSELPSCDVNRFENTGEGWGSYFFNFHILTVLTTWCVLLRCCGLHAAET